MSNWLLVLYLVGTYALMVFLPLGLVYFWRKKHAAKRRSPLSQMLLRSPGESVRAELDDASDEALISFVMLPLVPLLLYAMHISQSYFLGKPETILRTAIVVVFALVAVGYFMNAILKHLKKISKLRQGYEGEVAVAQELNQLMRIGAYVFHDVPGEGFNIDHVIVSPRGIYAVETKSRMKPNRDRGSEDANVVFDGKRLNFPGWSETAPLEQAARQARWLENWLSSAVGASVGVKAVLALPGWYVDRRGKSDVVIINGKNATGTFGKLSHATLSEELCQRVAHQLEQRCRDVEPRDFYKREMVIS